MNKTSINQFIQQIENLSYEYSIEEFTKSLRRRLSRRGIDFWSGMESLRGLVNPTVAIMRAKDALNSSEMMKVVEVMNDLKKKYKYDEYVKKCDEVRTTFLHERKEYFSAKLGAPQQGEPLHITNDSIMKNIEDFMGLGENIVGTWLDSILVRIKPETIVLEYEDLNGEIQSIEICHEPIRVTKDFVSAPLIDRYTGKTQFDSFLLRSFFDCNKKKWKYVPIRFIVNVKTPSNKEII
jgi:hypothetical protein